MPDNFDRYTDPFFITPLVVMGIILFCVIHRIVGEMDMFSRGTRTLMAICITFLSLYGFDRATVGMIVIQYVTMGAAILIGIAALIRLKWIENTKKNR